MKTMKALVVKNVGQIELEEIPDPEITSPEQVLIKIVACGICGSDIKILQGKHPFRPGVVPGHEFTGVVEQIGKNVTTLKVGDRISVDNSLRCGVCDYCRMGFSSQCEWLKTKSLGIFQNGGYAEHCIAPENACYKLPDEIDDLCATQVETLGTVLNGMNIVQMQPWDTVLILGFGPIGFFFASLAKSIAARVLVTEIDSFRFGLAKELELPVFNPFEQDIGKTIDKADVVIDAVGNQLENAIGYIKPGGKILAFGMDDSYHAKIHPYTVTRNAIKILGTYVGQNTCLPAIKILQSGKLNMRPFFTEELRLADVNYAFEKLGLKLDGLESVPKKAMKIVFRP